MVFMGPESMTPALSCERDFVREVVFPIKWLPSPVYRLHFVAEKGSRAQKKRNQREL